MPPTVRTKLAISEDVRLAKEELSARHFRTEKSLHHSLVMSRRIDEIQRDTDQLLHAIGVGRKFVEGKPTPVVAVRFYVARKLPKGLLSRGAQLPSIIAGIPTDVVEAPLAHFAMPPEACTVRRLRRQRPVLPGTSFGNLSVVGGTLGARVRSRKQGEESLRLMLSNNHVLADFGNAPIGSDVSQPAVGDGGTPDDVVGRLHRFASIESGSDATNLVDAAVARIDGATHLSSKICTIGEINGVALPHIDLEVHKHARTTGYSRGTIDDADCDVLIPFFRNNPERIARFVHQIRIIPKVNTFRFAQSGDSGALVVTKRTNAAVGLLFACPDNEAYAYANPIVAVLDALDVDLD